MAPGRAPVIDGHLRAFTDRIHRRLFGDTLVSLVGGDLLDVMEKRNLRVIMAADCFGPVDAWVSSIAGAVAVGGGIAGSLVWDLATGPTLVCAFGLVLGVTGLLRPLVGLGSPDMPVRSPPGTHRPSAAPSEGPP